VKAPGNKRLHLIYDGPLSNFAFKFNLRRYKEAIAPLLKVEGRTLDASVDKFLASARHYGSGVDADPKCAMFCRFTSMSAAGQISNPGGAIYAVGAPLL